MKYSRYRKNPPIGTLVTCENGHRICQIVGPIHDFKTKTSYARGFGNYSHGQRVVVRGDGVSACICAVCGAPWVADRPGLIGMVAKLHLEDGWWPRPPKP